MPAVLSETSWEFVHGIPRIAVAPDFARPLRSPAILAYGALPDLVALGLEARHAQVAKARTFEEALLALADNDFTAVAVDPTAEAAVDLIKVVKLPATKLQSRSENVWRAASRHRNTPFVILPLDGDTEYAVIVAPPKGAFLERKLPIVNALLDLDTRSLLPPRAPRN